ncbi:MAG TPA: DedA family protein [Solirubrobacteraceae bacterium]|jgi:membrane protein DedA with SNARE-associated domain|nr:DedA family protein [Solirubrobacteraceae bacterium]
MLAIAAIINVSSGLGYALPALIGLESMGVPSPGETALVLAAVLASQGQLNIWLVIVIGASSAILGDNIGYLLGRHLGRDVLESRGPFHERRRQVIEVGDRYFKKHGAKTVFIGRWIALIRFATAWLAGINHMPFRTFFPWNAFGGITWAITYGLVGYFGGNAVAHIFERVGIVAAIVLGVAVIAGVVWIKLREHRTRRHLEEKPRRGGPAGDSFPPAPPAGSDG